MSSLAVRLATGAHVANLASIVGAGTPPAPVPLLGLFRDTANLALDPTTRPEQWFTVDYVEVEESPITLGVPGGNLKRESGIIVFHVFDHTNAGETFLLEAGTALRDHFDVPRIENTIEVLSVDPISLGPEDDEGAYKIAEIAINYQHDRRG